MPYLPNLIPDSFKVLPDYFNSRNSSTSPGNKPSPFFFLLAILFFVIAAINLGKVLVAVLYLLIGFVFTPFGKRFLEKVGKFNLTPKIRIALCSGFLLLSLPLWPYYQQQEEAAARLQALQQQQRMQITADSLKFDRQRKDSLHYYFVKSKKVTPRTGLAVLSKAESFTTSDSDIVNIRQAKKELSLKIVNGSMLSADYKSALNYLKGLINDNPKQLDLFYKRAVCNLKLGNIRLAVNDLNLAKDSGFKQATVLYNKVNPVRRRVAYYTTRCCDGSTSSATGRGACSWHGGVCNWNDPVYEEYRKY